MKCKEVDLILLLFYFAIFHSLYYYYQHQSVIFQLHMCWEQHFITYLAVKYVVVFYKLDFTVYIILSASLLIHKTKFSSLWKYSLYWIGGWV